MADPERLRFLTPSHIALYRTLERAARNGDMCPTNAELCDRIGWSSRASGPGAMNTLERHGFITVERYQSCRRVTITATGAKTAEPMHRKTPHWRHR